MAPSKFSLVASVNLYSFYYLSISEYQIDTPCTYVGYISFNLYLPLVWKALWGYLYAKKLVSHQKNDAINSTVAFGKLGFFTVGRMCTSQCRFTCKKLIEEQKLALL